MLNKQNILVDIESIIDYRFLALLTIDKNIAYSLLAKNRYYKRIFDSFLPIPSNVYELYYNDFKRSKYSNTILLPTNIVNILNIILIEMESKIISSGLDNNLTITINDSFNTLNKEHKSIIKAFLLKNLVTKYINIDFINIELRDLNLPYISNNYNQAVLYQGSKWLDYRLALDGYDRYDVTLLIPALLTNNMLINIKKIKSLEKLFLNKIKIYEPYLNLSILPPDNFSLFYPIKEKIMESIREDME